MEKFAKLYENEEIGQILIELNSDDKNKPVVIIKFIPEGLGVCAVSAGFPDSDTGWNKADEFFNSLSEDEAAKFVKNALTQMRSAVCE